MRMVQIIVLISLLMTVITACGVKEKEEVNKIKIGVIAPLTGNAAELGQHIQRGLDIENNNLDNKYELIYEDDMCDNTAAAVSAAQKLANLDRVKNVIGPLCAPSYQAVSGFFNENKITFLHTSGVTSPFIDSSGEFGIPGITTTIHQEDKALADFIHSGLGLKRVAVFVWNEEWAVEHGKGFSESFTSSGGEIVFDEKFNIGDNDFRTAIEKIKQSKAEGVFIVALNFQNANIVKQIRNLDKDIVIFGQFEIEDPAFLTPAGSSAEGVIYVYPKIDVSTPEVEKFLNDYRDEYGSDPNYYAYIGYDSLKLYDWALNQCEEKENCVINKMLSAKDFPGVSGKISFNQDKTVSREFVIKTVKDGEFVEYK